MEAAIGAITSAMASMGLGAAAATTAGTAAATTASSLSGLSGLATAVSILGTIGTGLSAAAQSRAMADQTDIQAGQDQVASQQRQTEQKRALLAALGENDVTFAAAGIDLTGGIAAQSRAKATADAASQISIERQDAEFRALMSSMRAKGYRSRAAGEIGGALIGALGKGVNYAIDLKGQG